jgi:hypothetical protein
MRAKSYEYFEEEEKRKIKKNDNILSSLHNKTFAG